MKCIDKEGHEYAFCGYMVVAEKLAEEPPKALAHSGGTGTAPWVVIPDYAPAKIEVWQCIKCGHIKLAPAVFTRL